jgi:hypothetical protein
MGAPYTGSCTCGQVTATISGEPIAVRQCWCRQCQKLTGGAATANAMFLLKDIEMSGELADSGYTAASGNTYRQLFCPKCGNPVMGDSSGRPHARVIRLGFLDEGHGLKPTAAIWLSEAPDWAEVAEGVERFDAQPPPPPQAIS